MAALAVDIRREDLTAPAVTALIRELDHELSGRYPEEGANHFRLDADDVAPGRGGIFVAYLDGAAIGCGAIRCIELAGQRACEVKRMYVAPPVRGRGVARVVLDRLEAEARALGAERLVLETGVRQPEAIALYTRAGFTRIPPFGEYLEDALSLCMGKPLT